MKIYVNGIIRDMNNDTTVSSLLEDMEIKGDMVAVELNLAILDKKNFSDIVLKDGDRLEIINFVGGGIDE